jgi:hypothetical protein
MRFLDLTAVTVKSHSDSCLRFWDSRGEEMRCEEVRKGLLKAPPLNDSLVTNTKPLHLHTTPTIPNLRFQPPVDLPHAASYEEHIYKIRSRVLTAVRSSTNLASSLQQVRSSPPRQGYDGYIYHDATAVPSSGSLHVEKGFAKDLGTGQ